MPPHCVILNPLQVGFIQQCNMTWICIECFGQHEPPWGRIMPFSVPPHILISNKSTYLEIYAICRKVILQPLCISVPFPPLLCAVLFSPISVFFCSHLNEPTPNAYSRTFSFESCSGLPPLWFRRPRFVRRTIMRGTRGPTTAPAQPNPIGDPPKGGVGRRIFRVTVCPGWDRGAPVAGGGPPPGRSDRLPHQLVQGGAPARFRVGDRARLSQCIDARS